MSAATPRPARSRDHALFRPRPPLDQLVELLWITKTYPAEAPRERVLPSGAVALIINVGAERFELYERDDASEPLEVPSAILCGSRASPLVIGTSRIQSTIGVQFKPGGARPFFDVPMSALADDVVPLEALWGPAAAALRTRLLEADTDAARIAVLEDALLERVRGRLAMSPLLRAAIAAFEDQSLRSVGDVCARFDLSSKRLLRMFHDEVGLNPKAYWRVRRFRAALARLDGRTMNGAAVAAALGYADQAHFIREFRAISGTSPRQYLLARVEGSDHVSVFG